MQTITQIRTDNLVVSVVLSMWAPLDDQRTDMRLGMKAHKFYATDGRSLSQNQSGSKILYGCDGIKWIKLKFHRI